MNLNAVHSNWTVPIEIITYIYLYVYLFSVFPVPLPYCF